MIADVTRATARVVSSYCNLKIIRGISSHQGIIRYVASVFVLRNKWRCNMIM
jgi:hypothetical protein